MWFSLRIVALASSGGSSGCSSDICTCGPLYRYLYTLLTPAGWTTPSGLVAAIDFDDDTGCLTYHGGTEAQIKDQGYVRNTITVL